MSLPSNINVIRATGTYLDLQGNPLSGTVTFIASTSPFADATAECFISGMTVVETLANGAFSVSLPCTDNTTLAPTGFVYSVIESIPGAFRQYLISLPHTLGATVDLSTLTPVATLPNVSPYGLLGSANTWTGANTFSGGISLPSPLPLASGGTGAASASTARSALGVPYDATLGNVTPIGVGTLGATNTVADGGHTHPVQPWQFHVMAYGAKGDGQVVHDGAMTATSNVLTCATSAPFKLGDVGKNIIVRNAGPTNQSALVATITGFTDSSHVTLSVNSSTTVSSTIVAWATDDTAAFKSAVNAAVAYAEANPGGGYVEVTGPQAIYGIFGPLVTGAPTLGNAQIPLPIVPTTVNKVTLVLRPMECVTAATGAHWQQLLFQATGMTLLSGGVFTNATAQANSINANGHPCVIGGPTQPNGYGTSALVYSNMNFVLEGVTIITPLSAQALNYCGFDMSGVSQMQIRDCNIGVTGTFVANDFISPNSFSGGLSKGGLMPANGNNDICDVRNLSVWGGYTWAVLTTEHTVIQNARLLYCWSALGIAGFYFNSVGAGHAFYANQLSVEGCVYNWYIFGQGASGIGPMIDITQMDTESASPSCRDDGNGGVQFSLGRIKLTGLYTSSSINIPETGLEVINGQQRPGPVTALSLNTSNTAIQNTYWRWANVTLAGGTVTAVKVGTYMGGVSAPAMATLYSQTSGTLPLMTVRIPPGGWLEVDCTVVPTTNSWVVD